MVPDGCSAGSARDFLPSFDSPTVQEMDGEQATRQLGAGQYGVPRGTCDAGRGGDASVYVDERLFCESARRGGDGGVPRKYHIVFSSS